MKIAIVHNDYGKFSGEEAVVRDHIDLLHEHDCEVVEFRRSSEELKGFPGAAKGFLCGLYNPFSRRKFARFLETERPEVVHIHNLYPLINPCILQEAKKRGIPVVMTVHNFRLVCPNGLFFTGDRICEECAKKRRMWSCLRKSCLNSPFKSLGYALRTWIAQKFRWYLDNVDCFLCLTEFQREKLTEYGIDPRRCRIIPNFIGSDWLEKARRAAPGKAEYVAYLGRFSEEKGIDLLLSAARQLPEIPFKLAGAEAYRDAAPPNVEFVGYLTGDAQFEFMRHAGIQIMASRCYEGFPMALLQGMALGIPALVPNRGALPEIVRGAGEAFNHENMTEAIRSLFYDEERRTRYAAGGRRRIAGFSPEPCWELLNEVYLSL